MADGRQHMHQLPQPSNLLLEIVDGQQNDKTMEKAHEYQHHQAMEKACISKPIHHRMPQQILRKMIGG
jgi:hypothetical protein